MAIVVIAGTVFPSIDRLPPGQLLEEGSKEVMPNGFKLRNLYPAGFRVTELSEGWSSHLYNDAVEYCTIGYGHLVKKYPCDGSEPADFKRGLTIKQGHELLNNDLVTSRYRVATLVRVELTDGQFAALTDFVFNVGATNFNQSTLLKVVNSKSEERIPLEFRRWILARGKRLQGLVDRREREIALYFDGASVPKAVPRVGEHLSPIDITIGER